MNVSLNYRMVCDCGCMTRSGRITPSYPKLCLCILAYEKRGATRGPADSLAHSDIPVETSLLGELGRTPADFEICVVFKGTFAISQVRSAVSLDSCQNSRMSPWSILLLCVKFVYGFSFESFSTFLASALRGSATFSFKSAKDVM